MKTDIEIAQEAVMEPITRVAEKLGIGADDLELYGKYKAKLSEEFMASLKDRPDGKLILVTAINPTPAGEGKTTTSVGLGEAFGKLGKKAVIALREPSLGPCFGIKGGAAGGGYAQVVPMEDLNLHFTGDFHAITSANNLCAALLDNHIQQGNELGIDTRQVVWKRCLDMNDRVLRNIVVGLGSKADGTVREDHFVITVATEIMAVLCLAESMEDLKKRLSRMVVAYTFDGRPVTAGEIGAVGSMAALLKDAIKPNLIQTLEHTPALVHGGPFANIAHGCNSVRATKTALKLADYVITDSFHATAFSINLNVTPICIYPHEFGGRIASILKLTGLESQHLTSYSDFSYVDAPKLDFTAVNAILDKERAKGWEFLKQAIR